ncbi:MAG TPA: hypothetical protein VEZ13_15620, partial [Brevibacillus sp.]|nr:hypothetical protein [Brevibacillus sp.]
SLLILATPVNFEKEQNGFTALLTTSGHISVHEKHQKVFHKKCANALRARTYLTLQISRSKDLCIRVTCQQS